MKKRNLNYIRITVTIFFTVDRVGSLANNTTISLKTDYSTIRTYSIQNLITKNELINRTHQLYPDGLSRFGLRYLHEECLIVRNTIGQCLDFAPHIPIIESIFEQVRINEFPECPSRMQSMFGWCNLSAAENFNSAQNNRHSIYEVHSEKAFIADQKLLYLGGSIMGALEFARKYWSGERTENPRLEAVIPLPSYIGTVVI